MGKQKETGDNLLEKCLKWLYAIRNKSIAYKYLVKSFFVLVVDFNISLIMYSLELFVLSSHAQNINAGFWELFGFNGLLLYLIIILNGGMDNDELSRTLLIYYFLRNRRKVNYSIIKNIMVIFIVIALIHILFPIIEKFALGLEWSQSATLIIGFVIIALFVYIPLTESIVDEINYCKAKARGATVLFLAILCIFTYLHSDIVSGDMGNISEIAIFAIGQLAFAESAIGNYKAMYRKLGEDNKNDIHKYLQDVDEQYKKK